MTKKEIQKVLLEEYGIEVTLRPRKATLLHILNNAKEEKKKGMLTSEVLYFDDIYYECGMNKDGKIKQDPPVESIMKWLMLLIVYGFFIMIGLEVINFYTLDLAFGEFISLIAMFLIIIGIPSWVIYLERKYNG